MRSEVQVLLDPPPFLRSKNECGSAFGTAECRERHSVEVFAIQTAPRMAPGDAPGTLHSQCPAAHSAFCGAKWGLSSAGRAPDLHSGGQRFDPARLHQIHDLTVKREHAFCRPIGRKLTSFRENTIQHCLIPPSKAAISVRFHLGGRHTDECFLAYLSCIPAETNRVVQVKYTNHSSCRPTSAGAG